MDLNNFNLDSYWPLIVDYGTKIIVALLILVIGLRIIKWFTSLFSKALNKRNLDESLKPFLRSLLRYTLLTLLVLTVLSTLGIEMTSFIAIIGAAGLAVGLALQGTLQNFAGGVIILTLRPFKVGDYVEAAGHSGTVREILLFNTILISPDNKKIIVPNSAVSSGAVINYSAEDERRVDMVFGIGYADDISKTKTVLQSILDEDARILKDPAPTIALSELADSSVNFVVRPWVKKEDYWGVYFDIHEKVKVEFDKNKISIPFPQRDLHVYNQN